MGLGMSRVRALLFVALLAGLGAWAVPRLRVETEITDFLPRAESRPLAELSEALTRSDLNRTVTLTIEGPDADTAAEAARELGERLRNRSIFAWVRWGPDEDLDRAFYEAYFPHRLTLFEDTSPARFTVDALRQRVRRLRRELAGPTGAFLRRIAPEDPWLLFLEHIERLRAQQGELRIHRGTFVTGPGDRFGVLLAASRASPFDGAASRRLEEAIEEEFAAVNAEHGGSLELEQASVHRLALRSEEAIRKDVERVSIAGTVGVILLLLLLFRSPQYLALAALPLGGGMVAAIAAVSLSGGTIHGLTLAFGATLIGVAMDYVAHLLSHDHLARPPGGDAEATARRLWPGLALGAATTVAGLLGLAWTSFPGIRQMALFTSVGVTAALAITRWVLPPLLPKQPRTTALQRALASRAQRALAVLATRRRQLWVLPAAGVLVALTGVPQLRWQDDIRALNPMDPALVAEDERVRERVARMEAARFVVTVGEDLDAALAKNDRVYATLRRARRAGELGSYRSLHPLLVSVAWQRERREAIPDDAWDRTARALQAEGFVPEMFAPFREALAAPFDPLRPRDLEGTPLAQLAAAHWMPLGSQVAVLTFLHEVRDAPALAERLERESDALLFDQNAFLQSAYAGFRTSTLQLAVVGLGLVFALVLLRYRRLRLSLAAFLPALIAAGATLGLLGWLGVAANLLHVVALLLVLSMGVDYGVFMVETEMHGGQDGAATVVSLLTSCLSTVASFGALALSVNPALRAMGVTAALGVVFSLVLAPAAWILARRESSSAHP